MIDVLLYSSTIGMKKWGLDENYRKTGRELYKDKDGMDWDCMLRKKDEDLNYVIQLHKLTDDKGYVYTF